MKKTFLYICIGFFIFQFLCIISFVQTPTLGIDKVAMNEVVQLTKQHWDDAIQYPINDATDLKFTILDSHGQVRYQSDDTTSLTLEEANVNRDIVMDIIVEDEMVGKILFLNETSAYLEQMKSQMISIYLLGLLSFIIIGVSYYLYLRNRIFHPFDQLKSFAKRVASGNLDLPLPMDRYHAFGAFSESFDLMREELKKAKEEEAKAKLDKKELVAKLSHDIKTPVASIKAVSELMSVQATSIKVQEQLHMINMKANQIDQLISDLFHATLEELQQLPVHPVEIQSKTIKELLMSADYLGKLTSVQIPECLVIADTLRLQQVIDNVLNNSYKYANTFINIDSYIQEEYCVIKICDTGVNTHLLEVDLLCEKFYRGKNAQGKNGAGLGLYISKFLMEQMHGNLSCEVLKDGFCVQLFVKLAM